MSEPFGSPQASWLASRMAPAVSSRARAWRATRCACVLAFKSAVEGALPATVRDLVEHEYAEVRDSHLRFADLDRPSTQVM